jgi:MYXO-CTERM domain-containing protein
VGGALSTAPVSQIPSAAPPAAAAFPAEPYRPAAPAYTPAPSSETEDELSSGSSLWPALALGLALLAGLFFFQRRRRTALAADGPALARSSLAEMPEPEAPVRRRVPVQLKEEEGPRPLLEIEFKPDRMVATALQAAVHFDLVVKNSGNEPARNVRIEARMFNASGQQQHEIAAFLAAPAPIDGGGSATLQPQRAAQMRSSVVMPKESVREIRIDGRPLFIPTVVIKVVYQWGRGRAGQAHGTYLVGIENEKSPEKMGPFRLDMGPRIYRSVGGRQIEMARAS